MQRLVNIQVYLYINFSVLYTEYIFTNDVKYIKYGFLCCMVFT